LAQAVEHAFFASSASTLDCPEAASCSFTTIVNGEPVASTPMLLYMSGSTSTHLGTVSLLVVWFALPGAALAITAVWWFRRRRRIAAV
jgi:hypothetical protein